MTLATPAINGVHLSVLSEPLFLACLALTLLAMMRHPRRPFVAGAAAAAAAMVRYAGFCAPVAIVLWFFFFSNKSLRGRLADSAKAASIPVIVVVAWVVRNALLPDAQELKDVVVIGYGTASRQDITGAVTSIKAEEFNQGVLTTPAELRRSRAE